MYLIEDITRCFASILDRKSIKIILKYKNDVLLYIKNKILINDSINFNINKVIDLLVLLDKKIEFEILNKDISSKDNNIILVYLNELLNLKLIKENNITTNTIFDKIIINAITLKAVFYQLLKYIELGQELERLEELNKFIDIANKENFIKNQELNFIKNEKSLILKMLESLILDYKSLLVLNSNIHELYNEQITKFFYNLNEFYNYKNLLNIYEKYKLKTLFNDNLNDNSKSNLSETKSLKSGNSSSKFININSCITNKVHNNSIDNLIFSFLLDKYKIDQNIQFYLNSFSKCGDINEQSNYPYQSLSPFLSTEETFLLYLDSEKYYNEDIVYLNLIKRASYYISEISSIIKLSIDVLINNCKYKNYLVFKVKKRTHNFNKKVEDTCNSIDNFNYILENKEIIESEEFLVNNTNFSIELNIFRKMLLELKEYYSSIFNLEKIFFDKNVIEKNLHYLEKFVYFYEITYTCDKKENYVASVDLEINSSNKFDLYKIIYSCLMGEDYNSFNIIDNNMDIDLNDCKESKIK